MRLPLHLLLFSILLTLTPVVGAAERVALVVGNAAYEQELAALKNPVNDATAVAAALRRLGFEVIEGRDVDKDTFYAKITAFSTAARSATIALFFYAGHGLQVDGRNYLAPVDLQLETRQDLRQHAIELAAVLDVMRSATNLVILDACRNNPLAGELARSLGLSREMAASRGLARVEESASGTLIAYATEPGAVAADGLGKHSPYTAALLEHLETPGLSVADLFTEVTASVLERTDKKQKPWTHSSLSQIVRLAPGAVPGPSEARPSAPAEGPASARLTAEQLAAERLAAERELLFWESVKDSTNAADVQAYLDRYPNGVYAVLARNRLQDVLPRPDTPPPSPAPEATASSVEAGLELSRADRRLIQLGLAAAGFDPGPVDGWFGRGTRGAIRQWQASRGEMATGHLEVETAKVLLVSGRQRAEQEAAAGQAAAESEHLAEQHRRQQEREELEKLLVMVRVEGGSFIMGCQRGRDRWCNDSEKPVHQVEVGSFEIGKYEVTQALWEAVMGENPSHFGGCSGCPVERVSWDDVQAFLRKLNARTGKRYRLPTESEWEYAARGGRQSGGYEYAGGDDVGSVAWDYGNSGRSTHPVGQKRANELGLHDMSGNVHEWVQDCWNDGYEGAPGDGRAWERGGCSQRVLRGGSWYDEPWNLRAADRGWHNTGIRSDDLGFRIARTLTP